MIGVQLLEDGCGVIVLQRCLQEEWRRKLLTGGIEWREMEGVVLSMGSCLRETDGVHVARAAGQVGEAVATGVTNIIHSRCSEDRYVKDGEGRGER